MKVSNSDIWYFMLLYVNYYCLFLMLRLHATSLQLVMRSTVYPRPTRRDSLSRLVYLLSAVGGICMGHPLSIRVCISVRFQSGRSQWGTNKYTLRFLSISITHAVPPPPPFLPWPWKLYDRVTLKFYLIYQVFPLINLNPEIHTISSGRLCMSQPIWTKTVLVSFYA